MTPEDMEQWEKRLGPEKVQQAIDLVRSHGWRSGEYPPMWVWAEAFRQVESGKPEYGARGLSEAEKTVLGFKLF